MDTDMTMLFSEFHYLQKLRGGIDRPNMSVALPDSLDCVLSPARSAHGRLSSDARVPLWLC